MRVYTERPPITAKVSRALWDALTKEYNAEPTELWKNANCWHKNGRAGIVGNAWGWWGLTIKGETFNFVKEDYLK